MTAFGEVLELSLIGCTHTSCENVLAHIVVYSLV